MIFLAIDFFIPFYPIVFLAKIPTLHGRFVSINGGLRLQIFVEIQ